MREHLITQTSIPELLCHLSGDVKAFFKQELELVEKEMSEKVSKLGRDAMFLGIGSFTAGAGSVLLLAGIGFLLAFAFQTAGVKTLLSASIGFVIVGSLVAIVGAAASVKSIKAVSKASLAPKRTLQTVKGGEGPSPGGKDPSAAELHREALDTKQRIGEERRELTHRLSPLQLTRRAVEHVNKHPLSWGSVALAGLLTGGYFIGRKFWRA